jgi:hypothetical protein
MSDTTHARQYVPSPTETVFIAKDKELLVFGKELSSASPRVIGAMGENENIKSRGPHNFRYIEALLFSTRDVEFTNADIPMTDENFFIQVKDKPNLVHNVLVFNRKHNIRTFDFILSYRQLNMWAADIYKATPIIKQFRGSLIFSGCSAIRDIVTSEEIPLTLSLRYELIGDSMGEDDSLDGFGGTKGGPKICISYTYDENNVYVYINILFPYRINPVNPGEFQDISIGENTGYLTYEEKPKKIIEADHMSGRLEEAPYKRDAVTYCEVYLSLRDTTISSSEGLSIVPLHEIDIAALDGNSKTVSIAPTRHEAIQTVGFTLASDINTEVAADIHSIRFGNRALAADRERIRLIADTLEEKIKDAAISVHQVPFIINESIRFHGKYSILDDYFIDSYADSFGRLYIKEIGYYDAIRDYFTITSYFFDFNQGKGLDKTDALKAHLGEVSPEYASFATPGETKAVLKTNRPLYLMKSFEFVDSGEYQKYKDITYIQSRTGPVKNVFIELANPANLNDFDKLIYFAYGESGETIEVYNDTITPKIMVCNFKDYNIDYITRKTIFDDALTDDMLRITSIASYPDDTCQYSDKYLIGTNLGVFYEMYLDEDYIPVINPAYHNPFLHNDKILTDDRIFDNEPLVNITVDNDYIYFIGRTKFALYDITTKQYIPINPEKYRIALEGKPLSLVKKIDEGTLVFVTDGSIVTFDIFSGIFSSNRNNFKYAVDFRNNYASDFENINYNFNTDDISNASFIQVGQFVYMIGSKNANKADTFSQRLNILTGDIEDLDDATSLINPSLCTNEKHIFAIGGKTIEEFTAGRYMNNETLIRKYDTISKSWDTLGNFIFDITDPAHNGLAVGRLGSGIPLIAPDDDTVYIFHPELVKITDINSSFYNNGVIKINLKDDGTFDITQHAITGNSVQRDLVCPLPITWIPVKWDKTKAEFVTLYRIEDATTYYKYIRFRINYTTNFSLEIIENYNFTNSAFVNYADDYIIVDGLYKSKYYHTPQGILIFCRDKFILNIGESGLPAVYALWNNETYYPDCKSLLEKAEFDYYWKQSGGNKTHLSTCLIRRDEYIVFAGGEGYRASDYFDLNTFSFLKTPRYNVFPDMVLTDLILDATSELTQIPNNAFTVGSISSCMISGDIYMVTSIVSDSLALGNYQGIDEHTELPILLLFKIDTSKKDLASAVVKDLTPDFYKKGFIDEPFPKPSGSGNKILDHPQGSQTKDSRE